MSYVHKNKDIPYFLQDALFFHDILNYLYHKMIFDIQENSTYMAFHQYGIYNELLNYMKQKIFSHNLDKDNSTFYHHNELFHVFLDFHVEKKIFDNLGKNICKVFLLYEYGYDLLNYILLEILYYNL